MIDLTTDGYYIVRPEHQNVGEIEFHPATKHPPFALTRRVVRGPLELVTLAERGYVQKEGGVFGFVMEPQGVEADAYIDEDYLHGGKEGNNVATWIAEAMGCKAIGGGCIQGNMIIYCGAAKEGPEDEELDEEEGD